MNRGTKQESIILEQMIELVRKLTPLEKVQLIEKIVPDLETSLEEMSAGRLSPEHFGINGTKSRTRMGSLRSVYGICADLGSAPSAEEIDETRREVFENFPREVF